VAHGTISLKSLHFQSVVCSELVEPMSQRYLSYKKHSVSLSSGETIGLAKYLPHPATTIDQPRVITVD
jgi:hypothetical protein